MEGCILHHVVRANQVIKGTVALYFREDLARNFGNAHGYSTNNTEFLCMYSKKMNLILCVVYRLCGFNGFLEALREVDNYISQREPPTPLSQM